MKAVKTSTPVIDGIFHDEEWNYGGKATGFIQMDPKEGEPCTQKTEVYFLYDDKNLYVGFKCYDSEPDKVLTAISGRDELRASDYVEIMLDTFHDKRNAYSFGTTPHGSEIDAKYFNDGEWDTSWDGVWYVKANLTDYGWIAEFRIPFTTLIFPKKEVQTWGLNLQRNIERDKEWTFWQDVKRGEGIRVSNFGHLEDLRGIKPGMNLQVLPYVTSTFVEDRITPFKVQNRNGYTGVDVRYGITSNLTAVLTVNPDYAQIEADEDRINLTRYPYILREKRPFFLEGATIFNTAGNSMSDGEYTTALFYSRRVNEPVYGLKTTGKIGNWDVGVLHALNDNDIGLQDKIAIGELATSTKPQAFYNVMRLSKDIFARSQLGFIAMSKEYSGGYNRTIGLDGRLRFENNYNISYEGVKSFTDKFDKNNHSVNIYFSHYTDFFKFCYWYKEQAPHFIGNELGFYDYNNFRDIGGWMQFAPRFEKIGIRQMGNNLNFWGENFQNKNYFDKSTLGLSWNYNFWIRTMNYWMFGAGRGDGEYYDRFDRVFYPNLAYWVWLRNNENSSIYFNLYHRQGKYRTGYSWSYEATLRFRFNDRFNLEFEHNRSLAHLLNKDTNTLDRNYYQIYRSKIYYHFTQKLNIRLILQYNGMEDRLDAYYLLAYNFKPGSFLYVAYTERFDSSLYTDRHGMEVMPRFGSSYKVLQVKLSYLLQI